MHTETRYDDLAGTISVNFRNNENFNTFASQVAAIDLHRYQPIAMRVYVDKEVILTIYATDRIQTPSHREVTGKLLVRKFKVGISLAELLNSFRQFDFTLLVSGYSVDDFEVVE